MGNGDGHARGKERNDEMQPVTLIHHRLLQEKEPNT
jgi:hypothetical protein